MKNSIELTIQKFNNVSIYIFMYKDILIYETTDVYKATEYVEKKQRQGYSFKHKETGFIL